MPVEDVFTITGRGTVVTGKIERGQIKVNEEVEIVGIRDKAEDHRSEYSKCSASFSTTQRPGKSVGLLLRGTKHEDVERGQVLVKPGSVTPHTRASDAYCLHPVKG
jgi:elongation factor Tu